MHNIYILLSWYVTLLLLPDKSDTFIKWTRKNAAKTIVMWKFIESLWVDNLKLIFSRCIYDIDGWMDARMKWIQMKIVTHSKFDSLDNLPLCDTNVNSSHRIWFVFLFLVLFIEYDRFCRNFLIFSRHSIELGTSKCVGFIVKNQMIDGALEFGFGLCVCVIDFFWLHFV